MPQEEQVLREKLARLRPLPVPPPPCLSSRLPGSRWPAALSSLQVSVPGGTLALQRSWAQAHQSQLVGWGRRGTWWLRKVALARASAGSHGACLHCAGLKCHDLLPSSPLSLVNCEAFGHAEHRSSLLLYFQSTEPEAETHVWVTDLVLTYTLSSRHSLAKVANSSLKCSVTGDVKKMLGGPGRGPTPNLNDGEGLSGDEALGGWDFKTYFPILILRMFK